MSSILRLNIDPALNPTAPDMLNNTQLSIDVGPPKNIGPGGQTKVKLTIKNFSHVGRMVKVLSTFDGSKVSVDVSADLAYVAPGGTTAVFAIIRTYASVGPTHIHFKLG